jgi:hypothetical protein
MTRGALEQLYKDNELSAYITAQAKRFFACLEDQEDARSEVFLHFAAMRAAPPAEDVRPIAFRAIEAAYRRNYRRRCHEGHEEPFPGVNG